ncbi:MAG: sigma-70 family RNA polymerase sigma factor [Gemmataceae bacterium]
MTAVRAEARRGEFETLYSLHHREVWAVAYARRPDAEGAMELMQEAFLRLWRAWSAGETIDSPRAWLMRVVRNLAEDEAKSSFRKNGTQPPEFLKGLRSGDAEPDDTMVKHEQFEQVRSILLELAPADREVLTLKYALERDATEIAEVLGINIAAVHMRLSRARQRLAERLTAAGVSQS